MEGDSECRATNSLLACAETLEKQLDDAIEKLQNITGDELAELRRKRLEQLKKAEQDKQKWLNNGHGVYTELQSDREFLDAGLNSNRLVVQFYKDKNERSQILDRHLTVLAEKHLNCRFCQLNVGKAPFTVRRLNIRIMPTLALILEGKTVSYCRGFSDFGGKDDFPTEAVEWRLALSGLIELPEDVVLPVDKISRKQKAIRRGTLNDSDSD